MSTTSLPPGRQGLPWLGETPALLRDPLGFFLTRHARYGDAFRSHLLGRPVVVLRGAEAIRLLHMGGDLFDYRRGNPESAMAYFGDSPLAGDGPPHRAARQRLVPWFHGPGVVGCLGDMEAIVRRQVDTWLAAGEVAWHAGFKQLAFALISRILFGDLPDDEEAWFCSMFARVEEGILSVPNPWPWSRYRRGLAARRELDAYLTRLIARRRADAEGLAGRRDVMTLLLRPAADDAPLTDAQVIGLVLALIFAGHDTTTSFLTSLALALTRYPDVLARCRDEQRRLDIDGPLTLSHLRAMPYLDQVLLEIERRYPPGAAVLRELTRPLVFQGHAIPAGTAIMFSFLATHMDPAVYPNPDRFDPDRFGPDAPARPPWTLVGFGVGMHACLGKELAKMELKLVASHLLRRCRWELLPGQDLRLDYLPTPRPRGGLRVRLAPLA